MMAMMKKLMLVSLFLNLLVLCENMTTTAMSQEGYGNGDEIGGGLLGTEFYRFGCPEAEAIIFSWVYKAVIEDSRMAASLLRLHFHDCFVNASLF